jgi:2-amino-4-hydroxy-6-hydroxymethyldihydropteridine diphosphokinase
MTTRPSVFLGLGSNLGDRAQNLLRGREALRERSVEIVEESALYLTEPVGGPEQPWFVNQVVEAETSLSPEELLTACLGVERELLRVRAVKDGPRTLDVDLLLYGDVVLASGFLTLPHPRLPERRFVLVPLSEIAPHVRHPVSGLTAAEMLAQCPDRSEVKLYPGTGVEGRA